MVEIPDSLCSVFSATVRERDGAYMTEIPSGEIDHDVVTLGETYRVAVFESPATLRTAQQDSQQPDRAPSVTASVDLPSHRSMRARFAP